MSAWGTAKLRDELTVALLERDGWRDEGDWLASCVWCGLDYWRRRGNGGRDYRSRGYCSSGCAYRRDRAQYLYPASKRGKAS